MVQLSICLGSPAVYSPAPCFTFKYHQGSVKLGRKEKGRDEGVGKVAGLRKKEQDGGMRGIVKEKIKMR